MSSSPRRTFSWFLLILANTLWACSYVAAKFALRDTSVNLMNALRMIISALVLLPFLIAWSKDLNLTRRDIPQLAVLALIGFVINKILEFGGLSLTTASDVALLMKHPSLLITAAAIVGSTIFWIPLAGVDIVYNGWHPLGLITWLSIGWLAIMSTVIAYLAWFKGLANIDVSAAASTLYVQPLL